MTKYICTNDTYCPTQDGFETLGEFYDMCREVLGVRPTLTFNADGTIIDESGSVVLVEVE